MIQFVTMKEKDFLSTKLLYKHMSLENALHNLKNGYKRKKYPFFEQN